MGLKMTLPGDRFPDLPGNEIYCPRRVRLLELASIREVAKAARAIANRGNRAVTLCRRTDDRNGLRGVRAGEGTVVIRGKFRRNRESAAARV